MREYDYIEDGSSEETIEDKKLVNSFILYANRKIAQGQPIYLS